MRLVESGNINKSLLALANCINSLVENSGKNSRSSFIPWRDSKLTRLLKVNLRYLKIGFFRWKF
jgi:kinesin family protein 18/19